MKTISTIMMVFIFMLSMFLSCNAKYVKNKSNLSQIKKEMTAADILGNPDYLAMSYGGYRYVDHSIEPTNDELKEDMLILSAMGVKIIRTYKVHRKQAANLLKAIEELKKEDAGFEMYVMLGAWIDCKHAWTDQAPDHHSESARNAVEIKEAVRLANLHPDIVKIIAVGNEAMIRWADSYYVQPNVILKWVTHLQNLKKEAKLPKDLWITSSDDFASWGGGSPDYHNADLVDLLKAVDFVSMHTYAFHNTHYNPDFWKVSAYEINLTKMEKIDAAMHRARDFAKAQYNGVKNYMNSNGIEKPIHIGETGWASISSGFYGSLGSKAADQYKEGLYYKLMREWTNSAGISCFYFEAFNEKWKDAVNPKGSENHFGLIMIDGQAKYALWDLVDQGTFEGLTRNGNPITKTYNGDLDTLLDSVLIPPFK